MKKHIIYIILILIPNISFAQLEITEIMYDADGTDSGREWVEIYNNGEDVDLTTYKFLENDVNHGIKPQEEDGDTVVKKDEYVILADNIEKFLIDFPTYSGLIFDSAFSLNNKGENIAIVDSEGNIIHNVIYSPEWGAKGTGNSLQYNGNDWISAEPTPGEVNNTEAVNENEEETEGNTENTNDNTDSNSTHSEQNDLSHEEEKINLKIGAGRTRYGIINSPIEFKAISNVEDKKKVDYEWSFGDAGFKEGYSPEYTYYTEGEYNLVLNGEYLEENATTRTKVIIRKPEISIKLISSGKLVDIMLENKSDFEVNFGKFYFKLNDEKVFKIPKDTILDKKSRIVISGEITRFEMKDLVDINMYYPNGKFVFGDTLKNEDYINKDEIVSLLLNIQNVLGEEKIEELRILEQVILKEYYND
jgi:hypothetical protein